MTVTTQAAAPSRRRNTALAAWRRGRAVELRREGRSYDQIAAEVGFANRGTAYRVVQQALETYQVESVNTYRALEVARLDKLQHGLWAKALAGDITAVHEVVRIIDARCRVLGLLDGRGPWDEPGGPGRTKMPTTVVVPPGGWSADGKPLAADGGLMWP